MSHTTSLKGCRSGVQVGPGIHAFTMSVSCHLWCIGVQSRPLQPPFHQRWRQGYAHGASQGALFASARLEQVQNSPGMAWLLRGCDERYAVDTLVLHSTTHVYDFGRYVSIQVFARTVLLTCAKLMEATSVQARGTMRMGRSRLGDMLVRAF